MCPLPGACELSQKKHFFQSQTPEKSSTILCCVEEAGFHLEQKSQLLPLGSKATGHTSFLEALVPHGACCVRLRPILGGLLLLLLLLLLLQVPF